MRPAVDQSIAESCRFHVRSSRKVASTRGSGFPGVNTISDTVWAHMAVW